MITLHTLELADGRNLTFDVALPPDFSPEEEYPILLALPPGEQNQAMVAWGLSEYWAAEAMERGWIVLSPAAPGGWLYFRGAESLIPEFLDATSTVYKPEGGKYHLGGISNGGRSAFQIALAYPELIHSIIVLPGFPGHNSGLPDLAPLKDIPLAMFVGQNDSDWVEAMQATEAALSELGAQVSLEVVPGEGHVIASLGGGQRLFDWLETVKGER